MVPTEGARHYVISSIASKTGDIWSWELPDGRIAYRMSMSLRGWITETDQVVTLDANARPIAISVRGFTDEGDATENFSVDANGVAHWTTSVDAGSAQLGGKVYNSYGGPWLAQELDVALLVAAGDAGIDLLPGGHASISIGEAVEIEGPDGPVAVKLAFINGYGFAPSPVWLDDQDRFFGRVGIISFLPAGFEGKAVELKQIQDRETA
ncbi:MAG: amidohydrolase, partial [Alphaproteobacteria bacterium]